MLRLKSMLSLVLPLAIIFTPMAQATTDTSTGKTKVTTTIKKEQAKSTSAQAKKSVKKKSNQLKHMSVNINSASVKQLMMGLKGIGKKKAKLIVDYRNKNGAFKSNDDLLRVEGIGKKILKKNEKRIRLTGKAAI